MKYDIIHPVGEGAYGTVYKCKNRSNGDIVAIKVFKDCEQDVVVKRTTLREVKILRMLRHENIVELKEACHRNDRLYLVFEFVEMNLLEAMSSFYPNGFDKQSVRKMIWQLLSAIDFCHRHDVMHRDIKPENLLIDLTEMRIKLCDFGFARTIPGSHNNELTDYVATRWYRAPELLLGSPIYGPGVDIFAIGCILGEISDGLPLLPGESEADQLCLVQLVLGPLRKDQLHSFDTNPRFAGLEISSRPISGQEVCRLEDRFRQSVPRSGLLLMRSLLEVHPSLRTSAARALQHKYFEGIPRDLPDRYISRFPNVAQRKAKNPVHSPGSKRSACFSTSTGSPMHSYGGLSLKRN